MWLSRFGRTVASDAVAALTARFETPRAAGSHLTMLGQRVNLSQDPGSGSGAGGDGSQAGAKVLAGVLTGLAQAFGAPNAAPSTQDDPGTGFGAGDPFARPGTSGMWNEPATTAGGRRVTERRAVDGDVVPGGASGGRGVAVHELGPGRVRCRGSRPARRASG